MAIFRRTTLALCAATLAFAPLACSSSNTDRSASSTTAASTGAPGSKQDTKFGYWIEGDAGTVDWKAELESSDAGGAQQPVSGTWKLDGNPRWQLFTTWIESGSVTFTLTDEGAATVSLIRGKAKDPDDPTAGIDVTKTIEKKELSKGDSVTFEFP